MNSFNLNNKTVVVTGGCGLLGVAMCELLAKSGAAVVMTDIFPDKGVQLEQQFQSQNLNVTFQCLDITSETSVAKFVSSLPAVDGWINNAYPRTADWGLKFEDIPFNSWKQNVDMHLNGYFLCAQKVLERMKIQGSGSFVNMGSIYGILGPDFSVYDDTSMTMPAAYSAIKGGLVNLTRYLASYYGPYSIRVNCVSPGGVHNNQPEQFVRRYTQKVPLKRMATPEDIIFGIIYLLSDASCYVTGHNLIIDGGWSIT